MFGNNFKKIRLVLGLTQLEVSGLVGLTPGMISHIESGKRKPSLDNIVAICQGLNCSPNALITIERKLK